MLAHPDSFEGDWLGLFWASYIHEPENKTTYFRGRRDPDGPVGWVESLAERPLTPRVFASEAEEMLLPVEPDPNGVLSHNIRPIRYVDSLFYGRWRDMMLEMMFKSEEFLRLAIQPTGGGLMNPAWDFAFVVKSCKPEKLYAWNARVVFKPFVSHEDAWEEYQKWAFVAG